MSPPQPMARAVLLVFAALASLGAALDERSVLILASLLGGALGDGCWLDCDQADADGAAAICASEGGALCSPYEMLADEATRSTEAVLFDTENMEHRMAYSCCAGAPSTVVPGACLFSFRADPRDVCTPEHWGECYDYDREFGTLNRRGGRAWRSDCRLRPSADAPGRGLAAHLRQPLFNVVADGTTFK